MLDTIWALILPNSVTMFYVLLMLNFFRGIPDEIEEATVVDGAGWLTILLKLFAIITAFSGNGNVVYYCRTLEWVVWWYDLQQSYWQLSAYDVSSIPCIKFQNFGSSSRTDCSKPSSGRSGGSFNKVCGYCIMYLPVLVFYPFLQKYFVTGITVGSVKVDMSLY